MADIVSDVLALQARLRELETWPRPGIQQLFSVKSYGARGDGSTDDSAAFSSAITAALAAGGGVVNLPHGTYKLSTAISLTSYASAGGVRLVGEGPDRTIIDATGLTTAFSFSAALGGSSTLSGALAADAVSVGVNSVTPFADDSLALVSDGTKSELLEIRDITGTTLTFRQGARWAYANGSTITAVPGPRNIHVEGLAVKGAQRAFYFRYGAGVMVRNCRVIDFGSAVTGGLAFDDCARVRVEGCDLGNGGETAIQVQRSGYVQILNNHLHDNAYPGVFVNDYTSHFTIAGNHISACKTYGIFVNDFVKYGTVSGNTIHGIIRIAGGVLDSNAYGITLQSDIQHVAVTGNNIHGGNTGIYFAITVEHCSAVGNTVSGGRLGDAAIQVAGIYLDTDCAHCAVNGNTVYDCDLVGINLHTNITYCAVTGNTVRDVNTQVAFSPPCVGISVDDDTTGTVGNTVVGNTVVGLPGAPVASSIGIHLNGALGGICAHNWVLGWATGIVLAGSTDYFVIDGNILDGNTDNTITVVGSNSQITNNIGHDPVGTVPLPDGVTAPATRSGTAYIYVDTADGDLKIKYGDGTVKTIVVDT